MGTGQSDRRVQNGSSGVQPAKGERALIARIGDMLRVPALGTPAGTTSAAVPFGDDMAAIGAAELLWTTDMLMDGVDFDSSLNSWSEIGRKAMAVNLSDCAAMGVRPISALCAVALENRLSMDDAAKLLEGAMEMGHRHSCPITGGDTNSWNHPTVISITVAGRADPGTRPILRSGARPGDRIFVTGKLGGSILGRHLRFEPRVDLGLRLNRELPVRAMIDISDGLLVDLGHVIDESGCGAEIREDLLQNVIHQDSGKLATQSGETPLEHVLSDGEDFELIVVLPSDFTLSATQRTNRTPTVKEGPLPAGRGSESAAGPLPYGRGSENANWQEILHPIGEMTAGDTIRMRKNDGSAIAMERRGWEHFRE